MQRVTRDTAALATPADSCPLGGVGAAWWTRTAPACRAACAAYPPCRVRRCHPPRWPICSQGVSPCDGPPPLSRLPLPAPCRSDRRPQGPYPGSAPGHCVPSRVLGQPCSQDLDCSPGMVCSGSLCACALGLRYSRMRARCVGERQAHGPSAHPSPWNISPLDHPPIADMDAEVVETIPATYDCPLLVGMISVVLVLICLIVAAYCRFTDPPPKPPGYRPARTERDESYPGYPDPDPFDWSSETSPLRSSWGGDSDMSSLRRVKYCTCDPPLPAAAGPSASPLVAPSRPPSPPSPPSPLLQLQLPPLPPVREAVRLHLQQVQAVR